MSEGDLLGLIIVYLYIGTVVLIASRWSFLKRARMHRKFIHIMIGNIVLFWWVFDTNWVMSLLAAAPFIPVLIWFSREGSKQTEPHNMMEKELKGSILAEASVDGHKFGLVYYAISWTLLAFFIFDNLLAASIGIVCMAYGDGMGGLIGKRYGKHRIHAGKSLEGTASVFIFASLATFLTIMYYGFLLHQGLYGVETVTITTSLLVALGIGAYVAVVELYTPGEFDNLVIPLTAASIIVLLGVGA